MLDDTNKLSPVELERGKLKDFFLYRLTIDHRGVHGFVNIGEAKAVRGYDLRGGAFAVELRELVQRQWFRIRSRNWQLGNRFVFFDKRRQLEASFK